MWDLVPQTFYLKQEIGIHLPFWLVKLVYSQWIIVWRSLWVLPSLHFPQHPPTLWHLGVRNLLVVVLLYSLLLPDWSFHLKFLNHYIKSPESLLICCPNFFFFFLCSDHTEDRNTVLIEPLKDFTPDVFLFIQTPSTTAESCTLRRLYVESPSVNSVHSELKSSPDSTHFYKQSKCSVVVSTDNFESLIIRTDLCRTFLLFFSELSSEDLLHLWIQ